MSNIEELLDKLSNVPIDSNRTLRLIRELDLKLQERLENLKQMPPSKERNLLKKECLNIQDEKIRLAQKFENIVKASIEHLNQEISMTMSRINTQGQPIPETFYEPKPKKKKDKRGYTEAQQGEAREIYCFCRTFKEISDMIECDNPFCKYKWFHFECVGISEAPADKWFCKDCSESNRGGLTM